MSNIYTERFCHNCFEALSIDDVCEKCGYDNKKDIETELSLAPGKILDNRYILGRVLGIGGFGIIYKAIDIEKNLIIAIKECVPCNMVYRDIEGDELVAKTAEYKILFDEGLDCFMDEANFLVSLRRAPHIVEMYDCFSENNTLYFTMEFVNGPVLGDYAFGNLKKAYDMLIETSLALKSAHSRNIVHRDISPNNIIVRNDGFIKIIDFGNARFFGKANRNDDKLVLKPGFSPPELYMKTNVAGPWTDIYSLAATFYTLVTKAKLPKANKRINGTPIIPIRNFVPEIDYGLEVAINRALNLDYAKRQKSLDEFLDDIRNIKRFIDVPTEYYNVENKVFADSTNVYANTGDYRNYNKAAERINRKRRNPTNKGKGFNTVKKKRYSYVESYDGSRYIISDIREIVIGRNPGTSHIVINDEKISRRHCVVEVNSAKREFYITDWSENGTYLSNGLRIPSGVKYKLMSMDVFYVYSSKYKFKVVI